MILTSQLPFPMPYQGHNDDDDDDDDDEQLYESYT